METLMSSRRKFIKFAILSASGVVIPAEVQANIEVKGELQEFADALITNDLLRGALITSTGEVPVLITIPEPLKWATHFEATVKDFVFEVTGVKVYIKDDVVYEKRFAPVLVREIDTLVITGSINVEESDA
jgi:hypothetical protein